FKGSRFRSFLVVLQFSISIFLIIGTLVVYNQLNYIQHKDLGFDRDRVLVIKNVDVLNNAKLLKEQIKQIPGVGNATLSSFIPTGSLRAPNSVFTNKVVDAKSAVFTEIWPVDEDYVSTMGMKLEKGRNFLTSLTTDSGSIIINETAARLAGYYTNPLNHKLYIVNADSKAHNTIKEYNVIGVLKDFNFSSLRDNVTPVVMILGQEKGALSVKINAQNMNQYISKMESTWSRLSPNLRFEYSFMDNDFDKTYSFEQQTGQLFLSFTIFALIIACLGLFGLSAYAAEQRHREIGIRKVLGATLINVVTLLSKDFIKLVIIAILIATPFGLLNYAAVAAGLCVPRKHPMVDNSSHWFWCNRHSLYYH
ncbi:MAG: FtsX-like permease family protein, partial [Sphingobacteriaceae bacterium]